jgi:hypothetical protein
VGRLSLGTGIVLAPGTPDPAADARRLESLGFGHAALPGAAPAGVLLALGATRSLHLMVSDPGETVAALSVLAPGFCQRLHAWLPGRVVVPLRLTDAKDKDEERNEPDGLHGGDDWPAAPLIETTRATALADITKWLGDPAEFTFRLLGAPQARLARIFALDVLAPALRGRMRWKLYAEDLAVGDVFDLGEFTGSEDETIGYGERWYPLDVHTDPVLAQSSPLGTLCAKRRVHRWPPGRGRPGPACR